MSISAERFGGKEINIVQKAIKNARLYHFEEKWMIVGTPDIYNTDISNAILMISGQNKYPVFLDDEQFERLLSVCMCMEEFTG